MNRYAICTEMFEGWSPEETFEASAKLGYGAVELAPFTLAPSAEAVSSSQRKDLVKAAERCGVKILGLHWLLARTNGFHMTTADAETRKRTSLYLATLAELCADLGGNILVFGSPAQRSVMDGTTPDEAWDRAKEVVSEAAPAFDKHGVTLCFEPLARAETNFINTAAEGSRFCDEVNHPCVKLHLDVKAMSDEGRPVADIIRENARHFRHFHANDPNKLGPGMGDVKFEPIRDALESAGYNSYLSVEVFDYTPGPEHIARESIVYLKRVFG